MLALGLPAAAESESCIGGVSDSGTDSCMAGAPVKGNGTCALSGVACRD